MYNFLRDFDGSSRIPRQVQREFLKWLESTWSGSQVHAANLPVAVGKSALARAIQIPTDAQIVVPSNLLMDQTNKDYPAVNSLQGRRHYTCRQGPTCEEWTQVFEQPACPECPYQCAKKAALEGQQTFFNPMSLYYLTLAEGYQAPPVIVVDEAHQLSSMLLMLCTKKLPKSKYKFDDRCHSEIYLVKWIDEQLRKLQKLLNQYKRSKDFKKIMEITKEIETLFLIKSGIEEDPQNFAIWIEKGYSKGKPEQWLNICPLRVPKFLVNRILKPRKVILFSGTLFKPDLEDLCQDRTMQFLDLPSPIPKEQRPIFYRPTPFPMNYQTDPKFIVQQIEKILEENEGLPTIIHVPYSLSKKLHPLFVRPVLVNTADNKDEIVEKFKKQGGVFLASGCAEGLDLKDDYCRVNIIVKLMFPNLMDNMVQKRKALADGNDWYNLETMKTTIQQAGRSTRNEKDWSRTYVMDPSFPRVFSQTKRHLPQSFIESIIWSKS